MSCVENQRCVVFVVCACQFQEAKGPETINYACPGLRPKTTSYPYFPSKLEEGVLVNFNPQIICVLSWPQLFKRTFVTNLAVIYLKILSLKSTGFNWRIHTSMLRLQHQTRWDHVNELYDEGAHTMVVAVTIAMKTDMTTEEGGTDHAVAVQGGYTRMQESGELVLYVRWHYIQCSVQ
jgi:hypothetical protein